MRFNHGSKGFAVLIPSHISNANQILFHIQISPKLTLFACFNNSRTYWTRKILISRNNPSDVDLLKTCIFSVSFFQGKSSSNNKAGRKKNRRQPACFSLILTCFRIAFASSTLRIIVKGPTFIFCVPTYVVFFFGWSVSENPCSRWLPLGGWSSCPPASSVDLWTKE